MKPGAFSVSLNVKDLQSSIAFYKSIGFESFHGMEDQGWAILKNGTTVIGLFQGMFEGNMMTFNPGWDQNAKETNPFDDVRDIKAALIEQGYEVSQEQGGDTGPASFLVMDPDGNPILFDQHR